MKGRREGQTVTAICFHERHLITKVKMQNVPGRIQTWEFREEITLETSMQNQNFTLFLRKPELY